VAVWLGVVLHGPDVQLCRSFCVGWCSLQEDQRRTCGKTQQSRGITTGQHSARLQEAACMCSKPHASAGDTCAHQMHTCRVQDVAAVIRPCSVVTPEGMLLSVTTQVQPHVAVCPLGIPTLHMRERCRALLMTCWEKMGQLRAVQDGYSAGKHHTALLAGCPGSQRIKHRKQHMPPPSRPPKDTERQAQNTDATKMLTETYTPE
jgi:hypothetical protein